jgi:WD40 repeat protein
VACVDLHNDHRVTIYNVERDKLLLHMQGGTDRILDVAWSKKTDDLRFASVSNKQVLFWHPADVTKRIKQPGVMGKTPATQFACIDFDEEGWCYTGGENGQIQVWADSCQAVKAIKAHGNGIMAITAVGGKIISGGKDKRICIIEASNGNFKLEKFIDFSSSFPRSLDMLNGNLLVGLRNGSIVEFKDVMNTENPEENTIMKSHFEGEVWGLEIVPDSSNVLTSGDDNQVNVYNYEKKTWERKGTVSDHKCTKKDKLSQNTASTSTTVYVGNQ